MRYHLRFRGCQIRETIMSLSFASVSGLSNLSSKVSDSENRVRIILEKKKGKNQI